MDVFRNDDKDGSTENTTVSSYLIISGVYDLKDTHEKISYELVSVPYDIDKELSENMDNIEIESYEEELRQGKPRDMDKIYQSMKMRGIDIYKI